MENREATDPEEEDKEDNLGEQETETGKVEPEGDAIKIVINLKGTRATVGVMKAGCDPAFGTVEGNRDEIAQATLKILGEAEEKWKTTPRYPKSTVPAPAPPPAPARTTSSPAKAQPAKPAGAALF